MLGFLFVDMSSFSCKGCTLTFSSFESAIDHVHAHRLSQKPCVVTECGQYSRNLTRHVKNSHSSLCKFSCDLCGRPFVKNRDLQQHKRDTLDCTLRKTRKRSRSRKRKTKPEAVKYPCPSFFGK